MTELYKKFRPARLKDLIGQEDAVRVLSTFIKKKKVPRALLFTGPSGTGKTTAARIIAVAVGCEDSDINEYNSADMRGIDTVREIRTRMERSSWGANKCYILDEMHQVLGASQDAMLKMLEDTPDHVHFILATTDPQKLKKALRTRCTEVKFNLIGDAYIADLIHDVTKKEKKNLDKSVIRSIVNCSAGSARQALVLLNQIIDIKKTSKQLKIIEAADIEDVSKTLAQLLMDTRSNWKQIAACLAGIGKDEVEGVRWGVLGYARAVMLKADNRRAMAMIECFQDHFYDSGQAGLLGSANQVFHSKGK